MFNSYFTALQLSFLFASFLLIIISTVFSVKKNGLAAVVCLFIGALILHFFAGILDPFLNLWDERFHALVAKNLVKHPLTPTLYSDPVVNIPYNRWDRLHIWLHKPPLFLWQITLSFKLFGYSELALRLPSILMSSVLILFAYRIGKLLVSEQTGYYAAFLTTTSFYIIQLVSGQEGMDHNDLAFTFYVSASLWTWIEYSFSKRKYWIVLIGIFSGLAILNKWLPGLIVYAAWGISIIFDNERRFDKTEIKNMTYSFILTCIVFVPWQIFIIQKYPAEARASFAFFQKHITEVLEKHYGNGWYHILKLSTTYGDIIPYILVFGLILLFLRIKLQRLKISIVCTPLIAYLFFAYVKTKIPSHVFFVCLIIFLSLAVLISEFVEWGLKKTGSVKTRNFLEIITLLVIGFFNLNLKEIQARHSIEGNKELIRMLSHNKEIFLSLKDNLPDSTVLFNVKGRHYIEAMFYSGYTAYNFIPTKEQAEELQKKHRQLAIFKFDEMPDYLKKDSAIIIIDKEPEGYD